ncbi:MAG: aminoacyl-tRNA hydrolase [Proteobacteria bacterium]|nr:aminoacyl-tRNA hydrolase [Pseudomonadota bacterium]
MYLLVGLGNPGTKYLLNRHNIGFILIDALKHHFNAPSFKSKLNGAITSLEIGEHECMLLKPATYMNLSGECVQQVLRFYKIPLQNMIVFHDDLDLIPFDVRVKKGGGAGGHNGLKSLDQHLGNDYWRYRFGIGRPPLKEMVSDYVLSNFTNQEMTDLKKYLDTFCDDFSINKIISK